MTGRSNIAMSKALPALARLVVAALPLPGLLAAPARAEAGREVPICTGTGIKLIYLSAGEAPPGPSQHRKDGCAHFTCPRDRGDEERSDDEEA